jgi:electron transfer flavoprotein alpha subunit
MPGTIVIAEHLRGGVRDVTAELVTAAGALGEPVAVAVLGSAAAALADAVDLVGVAEILTVDVPSDGMDGDLWRRAIAALIAARSPRTVLVAHSADGMAFAPAVAAAGGHGFASDVVSLRRDGEVLVAGRAPYGGKVAAEIEVAGATAIVTVRPGSWAPAAPGGGAARAAVAVAVGSSRSRHVAYIEQPASDVDIAAADVLVSIGRGIGDRENIELFERVAARLGATLSSSRPLVDAGWMPHARQVGQSGTTVKPSVYVAFGISGAVQHLAGMRTAKTIIAINTDAEAPIFGVAHYGVVLDALDVAEAIADA